MTSLSRREALLLPLLSPMLCAPQPPARGNAVAVEDVTVIDGTGSVKPHHTVLVIGNRITAIAEAGRVTKPPGARLVDGRTRFLIPGLWDMHVHLSYTKASALGALLANGVTGVRDCGGLLREIDGWRTQILSGSRSGPRIYRSGPVLNGRAYAFQQLAVRNDAEARGAIRELKKAGVDFFKVHAAISREAYFAVADEATKVGLPFAGHIPRAITPEETSDAGQRSLEHIDTLFDGKLPAGATSDQATDLIVRFRTQRAPALFQKFAKNGTWFTPTLSVSLYPYLTRLAALAKGDAVPDPRARYVSRFSKNLTRDLLVKYREELSPRFIARQEKPFLEYLQLVGVMKKTGVGLLAGTDFATSVTYPGFGLHDELAQMVKAGLTPAEALETATRNPARCLGLDDLGTVEVGKLADLVLLNANPLDDIRHTQSIAAVIVNGRVLERRALDTLLAAVKQEAKQE